MGGLRRRIKLQGIDSCLKLGLGFQSNSNNNKVVLSKLKDDFNLMIHSRPLPSVVKFTQLLHDLTRMKQYSCSLDFFKQMSSIGTGVPPVDKYTANILIKCYSQLYHTDQSFTVLGCCFKQGFDEPFHHVSTYNTILKGFIRENKTHEAEYLFNKLFFRQNQLLLLLPNLLTYNTMIKGLCKTGNNFSAMALLRLMFIVDGRRPRPRPNLVTYNTIIYSLCKHVININDAFKLLKQMKLIPIRPNVFTYNSLIYAFSKLGRWNHVSRMLKQMEDQNISPRLKTFNIIVDALCKQGRINEANLVVNIMSASNKFHPDIVTFNSLIHAYCLRREMTQARTLFDSLPVEPNILTYNTLLDGYRKDFNMGEAVDLLGVLVNKKPKRIDNIVTEYIMLGLTLLARQNSGVFNFPNKHSYLYCLKNLGYQVSLPLFRFMDARSNLNSDVDVCNILIDRAIKCGNFDDARRHFHDLFLKGEMYNVETYSVIIRGFSHGAGGGLLKVATKLFHKMDKSYPRPNAIIVNDLVQGHLKYIPFHRARLLFRELMGRGYIVSTATASLLIKELIATKKDEGVRDSLRKINLSKFCVDVLDPSMKYNSPMGVLEQYG